MTDDQCAEVNVSILPVLWESPTKRFRLVSTGESSSLMLFNDNERKPWVKVDMGNRHVADYLLTEMYFIADKNSGPAK